MKKYFIFGFCFLSQLLVAQQSFETIIKTGFDQEAFEILVTEDGYLIPGVTYLEDEATNGFAYLLDQNGILSDSMVFDYTKSSMLSSSIRLDNGDIRMFGTLEKDNAFGFFDLFWMDIDADLNITNEVFLESSLGRKWIYNDYIMKDNGNIIMASIVDGNPPNGTLSDWNKMLIEITQEGDLVFDSIYDHTGLETIMDFIVFPNSNNYILYCRTSFEEGNIVKPVNIIDSNYILLENYYIEDYSFQASLSFFGNEKFITCSKSSVDKDSKEDWFTSVSIYDSDFERLDNVLLGSPDSLSYPAFRNSIVVQSPSDILIGSNYNVPLYNFSSDKSFFALYKLDENLDLQWQRFYGGDANYYFWDVKGTADGGCVMLGTKYEHGDEGPFERDVFIVKVNEDGLITSTNNSAEIPIKNAIVLPNPGKEYLELHTGIYPATLRLYNLNGQLILEEAIHSNSSRINTLELSSGTYIWSLVKDGQVVETGKWVRE